MAQSSYLCFYKGKHCYAIENSDILRILPAQPLYQLPLSLPAVKGMMLLDDTLAAVVDITQAVFPEEERKPDNYYIFLHVNQEVLGISADRMEGILKIEDESWNTCELPFLPFVKETEENSIYLIHLK